MPRGLPVQRLPEEVERPLEAAVRGVGAGGESGGRGGPDPGSARSSGSPLGRSRPRGALPRLPPPPQGPWGACSRLSRRPVPGGGGGGERRSRERGVGGGTDSMRRRGPCAPTLPQAPGAPLCAGAVRSVPRQRGGA